MSCLCSELVIALMALLALCLGLSSSSDPVQQLELKSLRSHRERLLGEIERIYIEQPLGTETQLLLDDLFLRDQQLRVQIDHLEATRGVEEASSNYSPSQESTSTQRLAINLTADFEHLQHKLDDLKHHLERLDGRFGTQLGKQLDSHTTSSIPPATPASSGLGSFFWTPLLTMPEFPQGSITTDNGHDHKGQPGQHQNQQQQGSPSIIKRVLDMLRPSTAGLRNRWSEWEKSTSGSGSGTGSSAKLQALTAEELLPQLQEQRKFLDDAIRRLELLSTTKSPKKH
ncbi:GL13376 [Drosophila persimilis]|uniref:Uncharacterized protein n=2 Tax=pseudoobscura subgroup TaxID=32358 RepID=Q29JK1_DROPS|nr:uncharacterized protein LOC4815744 [Drosophila pseudoobscura]XP_002025240.1 uncharacterized protein LOC6600157 [Drosophila persimilis]EDW30739.1 GL13376 [Drosophila persimilis]